MMNAAHTLKLHWPEFLMEAAGLGLFMISAATFGVVLFHPNAGGATLAGTPLMQRALMGAAMGLTAIGLIFSPWGQQSGAHYNPAVTLTYWRLGKIQPWDAAFYVLAQFTGGIAGLGLAATLFSDTLASPTVNYVATLPGPQGAGWAFFTELVMAFTLMSVVLRVSNTPRYARYTGLVAGALVAAYITFAAPLSGMSLNPARTLSSALPARAWDSLWIYFTAPPLGMLLAGELFRRPVGCAKLQHQNSKRCIFCGSGCTKEIPTKTNPMKEK